MDDVVWSVLSSGTGRAFADSDLLLAYEPIAVLPDITKKQASKKRLKVKAGDEA